MSDLRLLVSDDFLGDNSFFDEMNETIKQEEVVANKKMKAIKVVFIFFCILLIGELVVYRYIMPSFSSPKITVSGQKNYTAEQIAIKLLPMNSTNWFNFDVERAAAILSSESGIEKVSVEKRFPDKIYVKVVEREPVAITFVVENDISIPIQIDKNCVLFNTNEQVSVDKVGVPIISGLPIEFLSSGMRIAPKYKSLIERIDTINKLPQKYFAGVSEICVLPKETGNYELALIPTQSKVRVLTDPALNEDALKYMMVALDVVNLIGTNVSEIDLRYGSVSYKTK